MSSPQHAHCIGKTSLVSPVGRPWSSEQCNYITRIRSRRLAISCNDVEPSVSLPCGGSPPPPPPGRCSGVPIQNRLPTRLPLPGAGAAASDRDAMIAWATQKSNSRESMRTSHESTDRKEKDGGPSSDGRCSLRTRCLETSDVLRLDKTCMLLALSTASSFLTHLIFSFKSKTHTVLRSRTQKRESKCRAVLPRSTARLLLQHPSTFHARSPPSD